MATVEEMLAKAKEWEAAGNLANAAKLRAFAAEAKAQEWEAAGKPENAAKLRAYAASLVAPDAKTPASPAADAPASPPVPRSTQEERQRRIDNFAAFEMANPDLAGLYTPDTTPKPGEMVKPADGRFGAAGFYTVKPWDGQKPDTFGETAVAAASGPIGAAKSFAAGLADTSQSPSYAYLRDDPMVGPLANYRLGNAALAAASKFGDLGGVALSALGAGIGGAAGLAAEFVPGQNSAQEAKLAADMSGMAMFAVPELAGASSVAARIAGRTANAPQAVPAIPQSPPPLGLPAPALGLPAPKPVNAPNPSAAPPVKPPMAPEEVGALAKKAAEGGMGSVKAQEALAAEARINPDAKAAADRLGIDLPIDVFSDSETIKATVGLTRSEVGKEAEALWRNAVKAARDKADEIMAAMDGSPDLASVSDSVKGALQSTVARLKNTAKTLYDAVEAAVPKASPARVENTVKALNETIQEIGGPRGMAPAERALYELVTDANQPVTYGRLLREKNLIGKAIARGDSPYSSMDDRILKRMYAALSEDQLATVADLGNDTVRAQLREANQTTAKQKALEKRIVTAFGSDLDGSIGARLRSAITTASKGDIAGLTRILKVIPDELRKNAVASAIASVTRSARATEPGFGLAEFSKVFAGLKANKPVMAALERALGPDAMAMLRDLHVVTQRIVSADANVLRTGKANQALVGALTADGLVGRILNTTAGQRTVQAVAGGAGAMVGGPTGAMVAAPIAVALTKGKGDVLAKAGKMFASDEFQRLAVEAARRQATTASVEAVKRSPWFKAWAKAANVKDVDALFRDLAPVAPPLAGQQANENAPLPRAVNQ